MFTNEEKCSKIFVNFRAITFILLSLISGISVCCFLFTEKVFYAIFILCIFVTSLASYFIVNLNKRTIKTKSIFASIFIVSFCLGWFLCSVQISNFNHANLGNKTQNVTATVTHVEDIQDGKKLVLNQVAMTGVGKVDYAIELKVYGEKEQGSRHI